MLKINFTQALLLIILVGCANSNPIERAQTIEQKAYAVYGTYIILLEQVADFAENENIPIDLRLKVIDAQQLTNFPVENFLELLMMYSDLIHSENVNPHELENMTLNIEEGITDITPMLTSLATLLRSNQ